MRFRLMKIRTTIILSVLTAVTAACSRSGSDAPQDFEPVELQISMGTKAGSPGDVTYRTVLFGYDAVYSHYSAYLYNGSYRAKDAKEWMTPCQVNNTTGEWIADGSAYGLRASQNGTYRLSIVSPAVQPDWLVYGGLGGTASRWGYHLSRTGAGLKISHPVNVTVAGNHLNRKFVYQANASELIDRRAKVTVKMVCGEDLASVHVNKVMLKNIYTDACYDFGTDSLFDFTLDATGEVLHDIGDPEIELLHGEAATTVCSDFNLFALNYNRIDADYHFIYDVPQLEVTMGEGVVLVPFHYLLRPQYSYTYTLSVNSAFIKMSITVQPWNDASGDQDETVGEPVSETITFDAGTWDTVDGGTGEI